MGRIFKHMGLGSRVGLRGTESSRWWGLGHNLEAVPSPACILMGTASKQWWVLILIMWNICHAFICILSDSTWIFFSCCIIPLIPNKYFKNLSHILACCNSKKLLNYHWNHLLNIQHFSKHCTLCKAAHAVSEQVCHIRYKIVLEKLQMFHKI